MIGAPTVLTGHTGAVYALSPWRGGLLSGGGDGLLAHWMLDENTDAQAVAQIEDSIFCVLPLGKDSIAVGTLTGDLYFIDVASQALPRRWRFHADGIFDLLKLPNGDLLVAGGGGNLSRWDVASSQMLQALQVDSVRLRSLAYLRAPGLIAVGTAAGDVHLIAPDSLRTVHCIERAHELTVFSIADAGDCFYTGGRDGKIRAWSTSPPFQQRMQVDAHNTTVNALALSQNSTLLVSAGRDREVRLWRRSQGSEGLVLAKALNAARDGGHAGSVNTCIYLSDGRLVTGSDDRAVRVWAPAVV